ncbi:MAG: hypothetical protein BWK73_06735 [Thiothrix lacustris]|uniref:Uncharacterized protein n=1 Tax=Thiothrix lacustris TaxID=525917 RepID=A0A1Y1QWE1_9GAMM|nr:MAG: hypothetical protein BWK73_06735 [Thiothrix lacustris]
MLALHHEQMFVFYLRYFHGNCNHRFLLQKENVALYKAAVVVHLLKKYWNNYQATGVVNRSEYTVFLQLLIYRLEFSNSHLVLASYLTYFQILYQPDKQGKSSDSDVYLGKHCKNTPVDAPIHFLPVQHHL